MKRRYFLAKVPAVLVIGPSFLKLSCTGEEHYPAGETGGPTTGGGNGGGGNGGGGEPGGFSAMNNDTTGHTHTFVIACAHEGESGWSYTTDRANDHEHQVALNSGELANVFSGQTVMLQREYATHTHVWVIQKQSSDCDEDTGQVDAGSGGADASSGGADAG